MRKRILALLLAGIVTFTVTPAETFASMPKEEINEQTSQELEEATKLLPFEDADTKEDTEIKEITGAKENAHVKKTTNAEENEKEDTDTKEITNADVKETTDAKENEKKDTDIKEITNADVKETTDAKENKKKDTDTKEITNADVKEVTDAKENEREDTDTKEEDSFLENWQPPTGGLVRKEINIDSEMLNNVEEFDTEKLKVVNGIPEYQSSPLGSQKYDSSWDIYSSNYIYNRLGTKEKKYWDTLNYICNRYLSSTLNAIYDRSIEAVYSQWAVDYKKIGLTSEKAWDIFTMFAYSNPQYYFLDSSLCLNEEEIKGTLLEGKTMLFFYDKFQKGSTRKKETAKVKEKIEAMGKKVSKGKNDVQKAKIAHDLIMKKVMYDNNYNTPFANTLYHQSAYSVFCDDYTVCAGYTKAFEILMNAQGIDTIGVTSKNHAWNLICINDSWYNLDCTWDDNYVEVGYSDDKCYLFFNRSTSILKRLDPEGSHNVEKGYKGLIPKCTLDSGATFTKIGTYEKPETTTAAPKISQKRTKNGIRITLSTNSSGADIYYTLDGKRPSSSFTKSYHYTKPFTVNSNITLKAIAVCNRRWDSKISSEIINGKKLTIKFNTMGGQKISSQKIWKNGRAKKPANPKRAKYEFVGWYKEKQYKNVWNFNTRIAKNTTIYAKWKKVKVGKPAIEKVTNISNRKVEVKIKKVSGIKGYEIRYAIHSNMKSSKKTMSKSNHIVINKLKKGTRCYIQVRAYKNDSAGKKVFGKWSAKKAVKIKK